MRNKITEFGNSRGITGYGNPLTEYNGKLYETITLTYGLDIMKETHTVEVESPFWYELKCVEVPQKLAPKHKFKQAKEFEETDLISYLTEEAYKVLRGFDQDRHLYFETYLRRCLGRKVGTFFRGTKVNNHTNTESQFTSDSEDEDLQSILDEEYNPWEAIIEELELEGKLAKLTDEEQHIVRKLLEGYNSSEVAKELDTYKNKVRRKLEVIAKKLNLEKRNNWRVAKERPKVRRVKSAEEKAREKQADLLSKGNKILYLTAKLWGIENLIDLEMSKCDSELNKEVKINGLKELAEMCKKEIRQLEKCK